MVYPQLEEKLNHAKNALKRATCENLIELCKGYLTVLAEYRSKLYELQWTVRTRQPFTSSSPEHTLPTRKTIRAAIENTTKERHATEILLLSLTTLSGYEAVEIFNRQKYEGHEDWELRSSGVKSIGVLGNDLMTIQEAVELASLLRREEYVAQNAALAS
jgi:HEAT repeat protein